MTELNSDTIKYQTEYYPYNFFLPNKNTEAFPSSAFIKISGSESFTHELDYSYCTVFLNH